VKCAGTGSRCRFSWVLLALVLACTCSPVTQAQSSTVSSPLLEPIWQTLLRATSDLPTLIDSYTASWTQQIASLQANAIESQTSIDSLESQNADLNNSLIRSRADLAISEAEQARSEKLLDDSMQATIRAQGEARSLEIKVAVIKYGMIGAGAVAVVCIIIAVVK
jgi:septal ring factor EnvC (AmiA/AmiB activator)